MWETRPYAQAMAALTWEEVREGTRGEAMGTLDVEMLPARQGDAILLRWGEDEHAHAMLVDAGPIHAYDDVVARLRELPNPRLDLLVMTHVDADHVEGTIRLVSDRGLGLVIDEVWFNGAVHLTDELAPVHGEILGTVIEHRGLPWNTRLGGRAVRLPDAGPPTEVEVCCGLRLTVLAPTRESLVALRDDWESALARHHLEFNSEETALAALEKRKRLVPEESYLTPEDDDDAYLSGGSLDVGHLADERSGADHSKPNASSIVLLAEVGSHSVLLAGDTTVEALGPGLARLLAARDLEALPLTAFKLPHHGSQNNISAELVEALPAQHYLFSSNGAYFGHPDPETVATVLEYGPPDLTLCFNYEQSSSAMWNDDRLREAHGYSVQFPEDQPGLLRVQCGEAPCAP